MDVRTYLFNGIKTVFCIDGGQVRLLYMGADREVRAEETDCRWFRAGEVQISGENHNDHHFNKVFGTSEGFTLRFAEIRQERNRYGDLLVLRQENERLETEIFYQFYDGISAVSTYMTCRNKSDSPFTLDIATTYENVGIFQETPFDWENELTIGIPHNAWKGECVWKKYTPRELGLYHVAPFSGKRIALSNTGGWSSCEHLPMGLIERKGGGAVLWQIEHNGSWSWEISTIEDRLYLILSGPSGPENAWAKRLGAGETFETVRAAVVFAKDERESFFELTKYRRAVRRPNADNEALPVIFNDYMNCLFGDPTTEREIPLIDRAAEIGAEYYCIDCGWYDDGDWWTTVGEWQPAKTRFKGGLKQLVDYIKSKGMIAGLWLEIEVMGMDSRLAASLPDDWFFMRNGRRVIDHGRYQLDFSNPAVAAFADGVVDRLIGDYGIGYLKIDYNIQCGRGTETGGNSFGDGLLRHNRAYLAWLSSLFERHPSLVVENCASGGLRMDYANLRLCSVQSVSDQTDYRIMAAIAANCATAVAPEQAAVWSYPLKDGDEEETAFNMVNALLFRVQQSGNLAQLSGERLRLVREGVAYYKKIREDLREGLPLFLTDFSYYDAPYCAYGALCGKKLYVAVWNLDNLGRISIDLPYPVKSCRAGYPENLETKYSLQGKTLVFDPSQKYQARLFELEIGG